MTRFPQKWIDIVNLTTCHHLVDIPSQWGPDIGLHVIKALAKAGALKDPPKPREWFLCSNCWMAICSNDFSKPSKYDCDHCKLKNGQEIIHVREVLDE